ncbi:hypothetical protein Ahy_B06g085412 isoform B [Arachis hypogaea]|uniref:Secreted protein n=1 Tax=Arachis hypogaea TaxID=3818 RepID=A0A444YUI5_ARAHY|nr:hypothetical protein Ahy_B06g085412 isoform B [Arachis hypogaea]
MILRLQFFLRAMLMPRLAKCGWNWGWSLRLSTSSGRLSERVNTCCAGDVPECKPQVLYHAYMAKFGVT